MGEIIPNANKIAFKELKLLKNRVIVASISIFYPQIYIVILNQNILSTTI